MWAHKQDCNSRNTLLTFLFATDTAASIPLLRPPRTAQEVGAYSQDCSGRDALLTLLPPVNLEGTAESLHLSMVAGLSDPTAPDSTIFVKGISGKLATPKASSDGAAALKGISGKLLSPKGAAGKAPLLAAAGVGSVKDHFQELQASLQELRSDAALGGGVKPYGRSSQVRGASPSLFQQHPSHPPCTPD